MLKCGHTHRSHIDKVIIRGTLIIFLCLPQRLLLLQTLSKRNITAIKYECSMGLVALATKRPSTQYLHAHIRIRVHNTYAHV